MIQDPIADMLTRIRNGYLANLTSVSCKNSKMKAEIAHLLAKLEFVKSVEVKDGNLTIQLAYDGKKPAISNLNRVSSSGLRVYQNVARLRQTRSRLSIKILSTPQGMMTDQQAITKNIGGEVVATVY